MSFKELAKTASDFQSQSNDVGRMGDVGKKAFDPDKLVDINDVSSRPENKEYDPDKIIDVENMENSETSSQSSLSDGDVYDPDKPIEVEQQDNTEVSKRELDSQDGEPEPAKVGEDKESLWDDIKDRWNDYIAELKARSECFDTINEEVKNFTPKFTDSDAVREYRKNFDSSKERLISEWEIVNNRSWPTYQNDVYITNKRGQQVLLRRAGDRYDAHHVIPLCMGGGDIPNNITPLHVVEHMGIHSEDSSYGKIKSALEELGR